MVKQNNNVSVVILSMNEEDVIERSITSSLLLTSNVLLIDSGSGDKTLEIAKRLGVKVVINPLKNFSDQRNFALTHIKTKWVFFLDADEEITEPLKSEIDAVVNLSGKTYGGYFVKRHTYYFGKDWRMEDGVQRLFRLDVFQKWEGVVHETPVIKGEFGKLNAPLNHYTHRSLSQMIMKTNKWSEYEAKLRFDANHPRMNPLRFGRVMLTGFLRSYIKESGYRNGTHGIIESMYQSFSMFVTYSKLWELQEQQRIKRGEESVGK